MEIVKSDIRFDSSIGAYIRLRDFARMIGIKEREALGRLRKVNNIVNLPYVTRWAGERDIVITKHHIKNVEFLKDLYDEMRNKELHNNNI